MALSEAFDLLRRGRTLDIYQALKAAQAAATRELTYERERLADGTIRERWQVDSDDDARRMRAIVASDSPRLEDIGAFPPHMLAEASAPSLAERIETYLGDMRRAERSQTNLDDTVYTLHLFLALTGDKPLHRLKTDDVRAFLDALEVYPSNATKKVAFRGLTPKEILAKAQREDHPRLSMRTKEKHRDRLAAFLNAQVAEDLLSKSPHKALINRDKSKTDAPSREPFSPDELAALFDPESFPKWAAKYPHRWWGTILGVATGARLNEIAQLYVDDVRLEAGHFGIHIRAGREDQRLKNAHSSRFVPLPSTVLAAGFLQFVDDLKRAGCERLFPHLPFSKANGYGDALGDQFRAYAIKQGLTGRLKSFHCFRHNVTNGLINEHGVAIHTTQEITGHDLSLPSGLKHYVNPGTIPNRVLALNAYGPPVPLPAYEPGQFAASFKLLKHMEKRRQRAAKKRQVSQRKTPA
ncbi:TPA: site-specific integrase [Stenotrophomonas maltophilia]